MRYCDDCAYVKRLAITTNKRADCACDFCKREMSCSVKDEPKAEVVAPVPSVPSTPSTPSLPSLPSDPIDTTPHEAPPVIDTAPETPLSDISADISEV